MNRIRIEKLLITAFVLTSSPAFAGIVTYTSFTAFEAALGGSPMLTENYSTFTPGAIIAPGSTFNGITYASFNLGSTGTEGIISNQFK